MVGRPLRLKMATQRAERLLRDDGVKGLTVDPFEIAESRDIVVQPKPRTHDGVSGMLLRHGDAFCIVYATHIPSLGFQRFSIAHELGHYFLDGHIDQVIGQNGLHESKTGFATNDVYELEADHFAAGLLMPSIPFKKEVRRHPPGFAAVNELAERCITSRTATAIRYAELTDDAVAVIVTTGQQIDYCFLSDAMKTLPKLDWLRKGTPIPPQTATAAYVGNPKKMKARQIEEDEIDVQDWLGGTKSSLVTEQVVALGSYGKCLTILSSEKIGQDAYDDEDDDDEALEESWTPSFRR